LVHERRDELDPGTGCINEIEVVGQSPVGGVNPVSEGIIDDIENNYPNERFVLTANTNLSESWNLLLRANYYGKHFDERGRIGTVLLPSARSVSRTPTG
jgi:iron complex outermembrane receptor protein